MDSYELEAYAKINLGLDVLRRLENGYHQVKMVMQTVSLSDRLKISKAEKGITITADNISLPVDENNLIYKAAAIMMEEYNIREGVRIDLKKNIPIAAGLAGGSSDAAAAFKGINVLFDLQAGQEDLMRLGLRVGADVPYCIMGRTALAEGIGEKLTPLPKPPECYILIAKPEISVSTKYVYENLSLQTLDCHPDIDGMVESIKRGDLEGIACRMGNVLESVTEKRYPIIGRIKQQMKDAGAMNSLMSGSGPTVFGLFKEKEEAQKTMELLGLEGLKQLFIAGFCEADSFLLQK